MERIRGAESLTMTGRALGVSGRIRRKCLPAEEFRMLVSESNGGLRLACTLRSKGKSGEPPSKSTG